MNKIVLFLIGILYLYATYPNANSSICDLSLNLLTISKKHQQY